MIELNSSQQRLIEQAKELDKNHERLQLKLDEMEELRKEADQSTDEFVNYSDDKGFTVCTKSIGNDEDKFLQKIIGQYAVITPDLKSDLVYEGVYEKLEGGIPVGCFGYEQNGIQYFGELKNQTFEGSMLVLFPTDGQKIITSVKDGIVQGLSKFISEKESRYAPMKNSQPADGDVLIVFSNGTRMFATVKNGDLLSKGWVQTTRGDLLEGSFVNLPTQGEFFTGATSLYTGKIDRHSKLPQGRGTLHVITEGKTFTGNFLNGLLEGEGSYTVESTGEQFQGFFKKGKVEGKGSHNMPGKFFYEGEFKNGIYHGQGKFTYEGSGAYEGQFTEGRFEGEGKIYTEEGDYLEGKFKDWNPDGELKFKNISGKEYRGEYKGKIPTKGEQSILNHSASPIPNLTSSKDKDSHSFESQSTNSFNKFSAFPYHSQKTQIPTRLALSALSLPAPRSVWPLKLKRLAAIGGVGLLIMDYLKKY